MSAFDDLLPAVDERFERLASEAKIPGVAWGVVRDGALSHAGGAGTIRDGEDRRPDADSVYRIASMTKSFTATAVLLLRDEGRLGLDDPVGTHVPALAGWAPPTADSPAITIRHLLTMSAGLATDDPWGDRQQGLALDAFERFLASGPPFAWPPGTTFEYSNLGYGILGRVVTAAGGQEYGDLVRDRILGPLGMTSTAYHAADVPEARLAHGYVRRDGALIREGSDPYGALASMGGVFSSIRDLARWVAGFLDAFPARDDPEGGHPLRRASRREMQQAHRLVVPSLPARPAHAAARRRRHGLRLRPRRPRRHRAGDDRVARRRLPGLRVPHGLAPRDRPGRHRPRQPPLRAGPPGGRRAAAGPRPGRRRPAPAASAGTRRSRRSGRSRRACSSAGTTRSPTGRSR